MFNVCFVAKSYKQRQSVVKSLKQKTRQCSIFAAENTYRH